MEKEKQKAKETLQRALGWLEGIAYSVENEVGEGIIDAVTVIDKCLKELLEEE